MLLSAYIQRTRNLLQNPAPASRSLYSDDLITAQVNIARGQLAGDAECIRLTGTIPTVIGQQAYRFSDIDTTGSFVSDGVAGPLNIHAILYQVAQGQKWVTPRAWPYFLQFYLNNPVPESGFPRQWAQQGQGTGGYANFYLYPLPDNAYTLQTDVTCYPIDLVDDTTFDAIPFPWTDAVPFFAAYLVLLGAQSPIRDNDAQRFLQMYTDFKDRARRYTTSPVLPGYAPQQADPTLQNKLALAPTRGGG